MGTLWPMPRFFSDLVGHWEWDRVVGSPGSGSFRLAFSLQPSALFFRLLFSAYPSAERA